MKVMTSFISLENIAEREGASLNYRYVGSERKIALGLTIAGGLILSALGGLALSFHYQLIPSSCLGSYLGAIGTISFKSAVILSSIGGGGLVVGIAIRSVLYFRFLRFKKLLSQRLSNTPAYSTPASETPAIAQMNFKGTNKYQSLALNSCRIYFINRGNEKSIVVLTNILSEETKSNLENQIFNENLYIKNEKREIFNENLYIKNEKREIFYEAIL